MKFKKMFPFGVHPHFLIGIRRSEHAHFEQITGSDDGHGRHLLLRLVLTDAGRRSASGRGLLATRPGLDAGAF